MGEAGSKMAGGEKQRIALARAILRDPSILILDEFTNQNDPEAEVYVHRTINELRHSRTILFITHRLHTLAAVRNLVTHRASAGAATLAAFRRGYYAAFEDLVALA